MSQKNIRLVKQVENKAAATENCFIAKDGKKYRVKLKKVVIPGHGERTALELCNDAAAQQWLIETGNCSVIEEAVE